MRKINFFNSTKLRVIIALIFISSASNLYAFRGCNADDPGECVAECQNGQLCCVGYSPNCSSGEGETAWINCGEGVMECDGEILGGL